MPAGELSISFSWHNGQMIVPALPSDTRDGFASHVISLSQNHPTAMAVFVRLMTAWLRERHEYVHSCNYYASVLLSARAGESKGNVIRQKLSSSHTGESHDLQQRNSYHNCFLETHLSIKLSKDCNK